MNIKEFRKLNNEGQEEEFMSNRVFIEIYTDPYKDINNDILRERIEVFKLFSFYVYAYKKLNGFYSIINIQGVIDYLEPDKLEIWFKNNFNFHKRYITEVK
jgi:hypothetical protein